MFYPSYTFRGVQCGFESDMLTSVRVSSLSNKYPQRSNPATNHTPWSIIKIHQLTEHFSNVVNTRRRLVKCCNCKKKLFMENWLEGHNKQYHSISMNEELLPNGILPPADWDHRGPLWFDYSRCTWMAIDKWSMNDLLIDNFPGTPPLEDTLHEEPINSQLPDLTCTLDSTKTKTHRQLVENAWGKAYGKATGLCNQHRRHSEQWNPSHPAGSAHNF